MIAQLLALSSSYYVHYVIDVAVCSPYRYSIQSQVLACDARHATISDPHQDQAAAANAEGKEGAFVTVESKTLQPLDFFKISGVDVAVAQVPVGWQRCPDMAVVLEMRLEPDTSRAGAGAVFGPEMISTRSCEVRKQASIPLCRRVPVTYQVTCHLV